MNQKAKKIEFRLGTAGKLAPLVVAAAMIDAMVVSEIGPKLSPNAAPDTIAPIINSGAPLSLVMLVVPVVIIVLCMLRKR